MPRVILADADGIAEAVRVLRNGGLVAFPTETVYGLGARGLHEGEVAKIFAAKGRPVGHPLILHVSGSAMAESLASLWPAAAAAVTAAFWPGPLTVVVPRSSHVPAAVSGGLPSVALRSPRHPVASALLAALGEPLAGPSANAHTHISPTTAAHVVRSLGDAVDLVLDGGPCQVGIESTVLDLTADPPRILRPGAITADELRAVLGDVRQAVHTVDAAAEPRLSPGMAARHYAPRTSVVLTAEVSAAIAAAAAGRRVALLTYAAAAAPAAAAAAAAAAAVSAVECLPADPAGYARGLFAALHALDAAGCDLIVIECVPSGSAWDAVRDRLERAAAKA